MLKGSVIGLIILLSLSAGAQTEGPGATGAQPYHVPEPSKADSQQAQDDTRTAQSPNAGDLLAACANQEKQDVACQQILELNDFAKDLIDRTIHALNLKKFEAPVGIIVGVLVSQKLTGRLMKRKYDEINATYIIPQKEFSINYVRTF